MTPIQYVLMYLACVSLISIVITSADKYCAVHRLRRVPESVLLGFGALGGSLFMYVTMKLIHHKTRKPKFMIGLPTILFFQLAAGLVLLTRLRML